MLSGKIILETTFRTPRITPTITKTLIVEVFIANSFLNLFDSENKNIERMVEFFFANSS